MSFDGSSDTNERKYTLGGNLNAGRHFARAAFGEKRIASWLYLSDPRRKKTEIILPSAGR